MRRGGQCYVEAACLRRDVAEGRNVDSVRICKTHNARWKLKAEHEKGATGVSVIAEWIGLILGEEKEIVGVAAGACYLITNRTITKRLGSRGVLAPLTPFSHF